MRDRDSRRGGRVIHDLFFGGLKLRELSPQPVAEGRPLRRWRTCLYATRDTSSLRAAATRCGSTAQRNPSPATPCKSGTRPRGVGSARRCTRKITWPNRGSRRVTRSLPLARSLLGLRPQTPYARLLARFVPPKLHRTSPATADKSRLVSRDLAAARARRSVLNALRLQT